MDLHIDSFTFDARPSYPLLTTAKRYRHASFSPDDPDAYTLVFAHATGAHKECWEPVIRYITQGGTGKVREVWSVDCPNHGDAAVLNEEELKVGYEPVFSWDTQYARVLHRFVTGLGKGIPTDFATHRIIAIGHSMGAVAWLFTRQYHPPPPFASIILIDPMILGPSFDTAPIGRFLESSTLKRRDCWASREEAFKSLLPRYRHEEEVMRAYVEHALRDLPTALYPDKQGVTLKCVKTQELACYRDAQSSALAYTYLKHVCTELPVHFINGAVPDYLPLELKADTVLTASNGKYKSWQEVAGAGHMVPQMAPKGTAEAILHIVADPEYNQRMPAPQTSKL
ncbi:alpha/beta-hydrolase [Heliocybe sulcata]|uniref:Alpha/beta-hydrolase n=1 Tax=Heliocybe sulcata TaxID=5364 RepID=A0A5C3MW50_9AGAM|nr:alpha/beta-hydrolase [Heliocybe sulcata]